MLYVFLVYCVASTANISSIKSQFYSLCLRPRKPTPLDRRGAKMFDQLLRCRMFDLGLVTTRPAMSWFWANLGLVLDTKVSVSINGS